MTNLLLAWSLASCAAGGLLWWVEGQIGFVPFVQAVAIQFTVWGAINVVLALIGVFQNLRAATTPAHRDKLRRALRFNQKLNWLWLACGIALLAWAGTARLQESVPATFQSLLGHAVGVLVQGGFLFWFDRSFVGALE